MLQPISNLWPVYSPFNWIVSWSAGFKTGPVYAKSKSRSITWLARSKSRAAHALDGLPPCACGQRSFRVPNKSYWKEAAKQSGNDASQFFFKLVLALLVRLAGAPTNASSDPSQYPIPISVGWVSLARLPCLYLACTLPVSVSKLFGQQSCCLGYGLFVWQVCTTFIPFGLLVLTFQPASKPFSQLSNHSAWFLNGTTLLCITESRPTSLKTGWPVYKLVAHLQTGQVCNQFATHTLYIWYARMLTH